MKTKSPRGAFSPKGLKKFANRLFERWRELDGAAKADPELKPLAEELWQVHSRLFQAACARENRVAEAKDRRLGNPVVFEVFAPDPILGMKITTRTPNRIIERRVPTTLDFIGMALFPDKSHWDPYKPQSRPARPDDWAQDLDSALHYSWENEEKRAVLMGKRVDQVLLLWRTRFERERAEEARRAAEEARWAA